jgi:hypothetical protein
VNIDNMTREQLVALVSGIYAIVEEEEECDPDSDEATERDLNKFDRIEDMVWRAVNIEGRAHSPEKEDGA